MTLKQHHLTEDEMDEVLMGAASADCAGHLRACARCAASLAEFNAAMANFNQASTAWSEAKSNALSRDLHQHQISFRLTSSTLWSCASALVLLVAAVLAFGIHQRAEQIAASEANLRWPHAQSDNAEAASRSEIASDDAMLRQIDAAINNAEPSPEVLYGAAGTTANMRHSSQQTQVRN